MTTLIVRLFGIPIISFDLVHFDLVGEGSDDEDAPAVGGGSGHNFTIATPFIDERYLPWDEDSAKFGFKL